MESRRAYLTFLEGSEGQEIVWRIELMRNAICACRRLERRCRCLAGVKEVLRGHDANILDERLGSGYRLAGFRTTERFEEKISWELYDGGSESMAL